MFSNSKIIWKLIKQEPDQHDFGFQQHSHREIDMVSHTANEIFSGSHVKILKRSQ